MMKSQMSSSNTGKGEYTAINREETLAEFNKMEEQCKVIETQIREKNEEMLRLKQNLLLTTGAKMALTKVLGL